MQAKPPSITVGIDEAGRGAVLGPLVLAGCALTKAQERSLRDAGVADSKSFGPPAKAQAVRAKLAAQIQSQATWCAVVVASPERVDTNVRQNRLNALERALAEEILADAPPGCRVVLDGHKVFDLLCRRVARAKAMDKADQHELSVAAASILAKHRRDELFGEICARYEASLGPIRGGGYPNPATARFLEAYVDLHGELPPETRRSWQWTPLLQYTTPDQRGEPPTLGF
jgi:ribonuclease HII